MTDFKFTENTLYSDAELYKSLITHFNKIAEISKNKRFEWEDEDPSETEFNIGYDFQKWIQEQEINEVYIKNKNKNDELPKPSNGDWKFGDVETTIKLFEPIKDYFDGFVHEPVVLYEGQTFEVKSTIFKTYNALVEFCKDLRQNSQTVFIFRLTETKFRPLISGDLSKMDSELVYGEEEIYYRIRYIDIPFKL